jgi:hypothetical protein
MSYPETEPKKYKLQDLPKIYRFYKKHGKTPNEMLQDLKKSSIILDVGKFIQKEPVLAKRKELQKYYDVDLGKYKESKPNVRILNKEEYEKLLSIPEEDEEDEEDEDEELFKNRKTLVGNGLKTILKKKVASKKKLSKKRKVTSKKKKVISKKRKVASKKKLSKKKKVISKKRKVASKKKLSKKRKVTNKKKILSKKKKSIL